MSVAWFFLSSLALKNNPVPLDGETLRHIHALRLQDGAEVVVSDGKGRAWQARLALAKGRGGHVFMLDELPQNNEPPFEVILIVSLIKGEKMDRIVHGAVELGVKQVIPVFTERTVVKLPRAKRAEKSNRWQKIATAAASLCRRSYVPPVHVPLEFGEVLKLLAKEKLVIVPWEEEKERGLLSLMQGFKSPPRRAFLFTGPEGGFSRTEMSKLMELPSVYPVSLGSRILSAQTAPLAALSVMMAVLGDLG